MCLTDSEQLQIQAEVEAAFAGDPPPDPAVWLEDYAVNFAHGAARPSGSSPLTPGHVVAFAHQLRDELWGAMLDLTERVIRDAVWWVGRRVVGLDGQCLLDW